MNIFMLDEDPRRAAQAHCDKHVVKMVIETAQLLSTAHRVLDGDERADRLALYKATHHNHPSAVWVRECFESYSWALLLFHNLCDEYTHRYGRRHASERLLGPLGMFPACIPYGVVGSFRLADAPQAMPDYCKIPGDPVSAYRHYYATEKRHLGQWKRRAAPEWWATA